MRCKSNRLKAKRWKRFHDAAYQFAHWKNSSFLNGKEMTSLANTTYEVGS